MSKETVYTETSLSDSIVYQKFKGNGEMITKMVKYVKNSITITKEYIDEQLLQIDRTRISPLREKVVESYEKGDINILYVKNDKVPQVLPFFATKMGGHIKVIILINNYGVISKTNMDSGKKVLDIPMKNLYALMEGAYVYYQTLTYPKNITKSLGLMKTSTTIYSQLCLRILNKEYALSMSPVEYDQVSFLLGKFFAEKVWGSSNEDINFSYAKATINHPINVADIVRVDDLYKAREISNIEELMELLKEVSPRLTNLNYRYFIQAWINTYKAPSLFGLECLPYFLFTISCSLLGSFIVNQPIITNVTNNVKGMNTFYNELVKVMI